MKQPMHCNQRFAAYPRAAIRLGVILGLLACSASLARAAGPTPPDFGPNVLVFNPSMPVSGDPGADRQGLRHPAEQRVRPRALCPAVPARRLQCRRSGRLLHAGSGPGRLARQRSHHRQCPRRRQPAAQQRHLHLLAGRRGLLRHARRRHDAVGRLAGRALPPHARSRRHCAPPERRLGQRRLDVRLLIDGNVGAGPQQQWISRNSEWGSWTGANWNMVFVGVRQSASWRMAHAALHQGRPDPHRSREAIPPGRCAGQL